MGAPKPEKPTPPPPPVSETGQDVAQAKKDQRRREAGRYSFDKTLLAASNAAPGTKSTLG
jgi:cell division septation protein DedD